MELLLGAKARTACVKCEATRITIEIHIIYEVHQEFTMALALGPKKIPELAIKFIKITYMPCSLTLLGHMLCEGPLATKIKAQAQTKAQVHAQAQNVELKQSILIQGS